MTTRFGALGAAAALLLLAAPVRAGSESEYEVTVTNVTRAQTFTPILVATHRSDVRLFTPGEEASGELELLAEAGETGALADTLRAEGADATTIPGLLGPGETVSVRVAAGRRHTHLSVAAMLIPTNDHFFALNAARLPFFAPAMHPVPAWDAGTEANDQSCAHIPGPRCGGEGHSPEAQDGDEGHVHVGRGFHDLGEEDAEGNEVLGPATYDWRNPVALVRVRRLR